LHVVPSALLARDMRFADAARAQVLGSLSGALLAIALAWQGVGVWALAAQTLFGSAVVLSILVNSLRWRPHFEFSWPKVEPLARFSFPMLGNNLIGYAIRNADSLLVGRFLGPGPLGLYSMAIQLMVYPLQQVSSVIVRVLYPTMVQIRDDLPRLRAAYLRAVGGIAVLTFPMMGGLFAVADDFVAVVFGREWMEMAPVLKVVAWVGLMQSIGTTVGTIYITVGKPQVALRVSLIGAPVLIGGMAAGLHWGILGVAIGYGIASFSFFYYSIVQAFRLVGLKVAELHVAIARPLLATLAMVGVVAFAILALQSSQPAYRLGIAITIGVVAYAAFSLVLNRQQLADILTMLRSARRAK
jgi:O-antigen/teichoic acid export membrane protein